MNVCEHIERKYTLWLVSGFELIKNNIKKSTKKASINSREHKLCEKGKVILIKARNKLEENI